MTQNISHNWSKILNFKHETNKIGYLQIKWDICRILLSHVSDSILEVIQRNEYENEQTLKTVG